VSVTVGVELFNAVGGVGNDAAATSLTLMPGQTLAFGTGFALNFTVDSVIGGLISSKYSARVLSTSKKIGCNAFVMDVANAPPTSGWAAHDHREDEAEGGKLVTPPMTRTLPFRPDAVRGEHAGDRPERAVPAALG
jgi:hypothetical protein